MEELVDEKKHYMPHLIKIQLNIKYMIVDNDDVPEGIANETVGSLRNYIMHEKQQDQIDTLLFDLLEEDVGYNRICSFTITNHILKKLVLPMSLAEVKKLTPIKRASAKINIASSRFKWSFQRTQFQIVACKAITVSKIQGDTIEKVAFDISQNIPDMRSNYYVAMSRMTKKENLYLYGANCLIGNKRVGTGYGVGEKRFISSLTANEAKKARQYYLENSIVQVEMARMRRDKKVCLDFGKIFENKSSSYIKRGLGVISDGQTDGRTSSRLHRLEHYKT